MPRTRIIIGHPAKTGSALPHLVYLGTSGSEAESVMKADQTAHHYEIFEGPGRRKNNASFNPQAKAPLAVPASEPVKFELPADLKGLKKEELANALVGAIARIQNLEDVNAALLASSQQQQAQGNQFQIVTEPGGPAVPIVSGDPLSSEVAV